MEANELDSFDGALFDSLGFTHPLIALMPYAESAPDPLLTLQAWVWKALDPGLPYVDRVRATLAIRGAIGNIGLEVKEAANVAIDLLRGLNELLLSSAVLEQRAWAYLDQEGVGLEGRRFSSPPSGLPSLVRIDPASGKLTSAAAIVARSEALRIWTSVSLQLSSKPNSAFASMCSPDLRASLRMLILFLMHSDVDPSRATRSGKLDRFEDMGLSLWECLLAQLRKMPDYRLDTDEDLFGANVQNAMWHFLRSRDLTQPLACEIDSNRSESPSSTTPASTHVVVRGEIPLGATEEDRQTLARYDRLRRPLPVARLPEIAGINALEHRLISEFPWASSAVGAIVDDLRARRLVGGVELGMVPTLFVGRPGCGKSRLARRIAEELQTPFLGMSLAGMGDSRAILGTARGWSGGEPSPLVRLLLNKSSASAMVMLDELDKAHAGTRSDVAPTSALLNLLESENAKSWYDTFLQTACDLSKLMYVATANTLSTIPRPLLSRLRIIVIPEPRRADFGAIARTVLIDVAQEWGLPAMTFRELADSISVGPARNAREIRAFVQGYLADWAQKTLGPGRTH